LHVLVSPASTYTRLARAVCTVRATPTAPLLVDVGTALVEVGANWAKDKLAARLERLLVTTLSIRRCLFLGPPRWRP